MRARKRFGQHFLEPAWVAKLITAIEPKPSDRFIEIGPGRGAITMPLAVQVERLVAIEVDRDLAARLQAQVPANVSVVTGDVLTLDLGQLAARELDASPDNRVRVAGNIPYNISTPILFRLLQTAAATGALEDATLMLQKEVADRLLADPGTGEYGVLTISTALGADVSAVLALPPGAFRPPPKVRSTVVRLTFRSAPAGVRHPDLVQEIVRNVFTQRRKMLSNSLEPVAARYGMTAAAALAAAGLDPRRRPETLTLEEFGRLADAFTVTSSKFKVQS